MESSIFKYIRRYSLRQQVWIVIVSAFSFPFLYLFYELPKRIVNNAILADPETFPAEFLFFELGHLPFLFALCGVFLGPGDALQALVLRSAQSALEERRHAGGARCRRLSGQRGA